MDYKYRLPERVEQLVAATDEPDVKKLTRLAHAKGMYQAVRDWRTFRQDDAIMEAAKAACTHLLLEEPEEGTAVTNSPEMFSLLFLQTYYGCAGYLEHPMNERMNHVASTA